LAKSIIFAVEKFRLRVLQGAVLAGNAGRPEAAGLTTDNS
jgi:hypothetical protein